MSRRSDEREDERMEVYYARKYDGAPSDLDRILEFEERAEREERARGER